MALTKDLKLENVVILANIFNPSIFSTHWLITKDICPETEIDAVKSVYAQNISQTVSPDYQLLVLPEQIQFSKSPICNQDFFALVQSKVIRIVEFLPQVPYVQAGINFHWYLKDSEKSIQDLSRELFYIPNSKVHKRFDHKDSQFGANLSFGIEDVRLKLDIKPVLMLTEPDQKNQLLFAFNFHKDLKTENGDVSKELLIFLKKFGTLREEARKIMELYV